MYRLEGPSEWGLDTSIKGEGMRPRVNDLKATKTNPTQGHKSQVSGTGSLCLRMIPAGTVYYSVVKLYGNVLK